MSKAAVEGYAANLALYEKLVETNSSVDRKGASMPYTSLNGHMFSMLTKEGKLALRLPAEERELFLKDYETTLCEQDGRVLKEYVEVPDALLERTEELKQCFDLSYAYVATLKPKPTKRIFMMEWLAWWCYSSGGRLAPPSEGEALCGLRSNLPAESSPD